MSLDTRLVIMLSNARTGAGAVNAADSPSSIRRWKPTPRSRPSPKRPGEAATATIYLTRLAGTRSAEVEYTGLARYGLRGRGTAATKRLALYGAS